MKSHTKKKSSLQILNVGKEQGRRMYLNSLVIISISSNTHWDGSICHLLWLQEVQTGSTFSFLTVFWKCDLEMSCYSYCDVGILGSLLGRVSSTLSFSVSLTQRSGREKHTPIKAKCCLLEISSLQGWFLEPAAKANFGWCIRERRNHCEVTMEGGWPLIDSWLGEASTNCCVESLVGSQP